MLRQCAALGDCRKKTRCVCREREIDVLCICESTSSSILCTIVCKPVRSEAQGLWIGVQNDQDHKDISCSSRSTGSCFFEQALLQIQTFYAAIGFI